MLFPSTPILDTFTGADEDPITTNWTTPSFSDGGNLERLNNAIGGRGEDAYYDVQQFGENIEGYATIAVFNNTEGDAYAIRSRVQNVGGPGSGRSWLYVAIFKSGGSWFMNGWEVIVGSSTQIISNTAIAAPSVGAKIGLRSLNDELQGWYDSGSGWSMVSSGGTTLTGGGYIGVGFTGGGLYLDDFGGGNIATSGRRYKRLVGPQQIPTSEATLYTVPDGTRARVRNIHLSNPGVSSIGVSLEIGGVLSFERPVAAGDVYAARRPIEVTLEAGDVISGYASSSGVVAVIDGVEEAV